ncbi:MAG: collagenase-like PrtC family protease [Oceanicoccus sp.]|jgi:collagenase-like PrtC family protease
MELLSPAGSLASLKAAVDEGADAVYLGFKNDTNARHFAGLNFNDRQLDQGVAYAHQHKTNVHIALNTFAHPNRSRIWFDAVKKVVDIGADILIASNIAVLEYAATHFPELELHLSVQASATNAAAINFFKPFGIKRVVLPRVLSFQQVANLKQDTNLDLEVFAYGSLCIMAEGRCYLSSYMTGESPNTVGACSPAQYVRWEQTPQGLESRLNNVLIDRFAENEKAGYPTLCKGRFNVDDTLYHALEEPTSLNTMSLLPKLYELGICSLKIEGRQRSPAYTRDVTRVWRQAIDAVKKDPQNFKEATAWQLQLSQLSEGSQTTLGAYERNWQ